MKKKLVIVLSLILIFVVTFISVGKTYADENNDHSLIYDIEQMNFDVNSGTISFSGWAFIHEYNNNGGSSTKINIYATAVGGGTKVYATNLTYNGGKDSTLYQANCTRVGSDPNTRQCKENYNESTCNGTKYSSCKYDNVGFFASIKIEDIINQIGTDKDVIFKINVVNQTSRNGKSITTNKTENIAVDKLSTNVQNGTQKGTFGDKEYEIKIADISSTLGMRANWANVVRENGEFVDKTGLKWQQFKKYNINSKILSSNNVKNINGLKMYNLSYTKSGSSAVPGGVSSGYAYASWIKLDGYVKIRFKGEEEPVQVCDIDNEDAKVDLDLHCESEEINKEAALSVSVPNLEGDYIRSIAYDSDEYKKFGGSDKSAKTFYTNKSKTCALPLYEDSISAVAIAHQEGDANFNVTPTSIYSGGGFAFSAKYAGMAYYELCDKILNFTMYEYIVIRECNSKPTGDCSEGVPDSSTGKCSHTCKKEKWVSSGKPDENGNCPKGETKRNGKCGSYEDVEETKYTSLTEYCDKSAKSFSCTQDNYSEKCPVEMSLFAKTMADEFIEDDIPSKDEFTTTSPDSNDIDGGEQTLEEWTETRNYKGKKSWMPMEMLEYKATYNPRRACINRITAIVTYTDGECNLDKEIDGGLLIYTPVKYREIEFAVSVNMPQISIIPKFMEWSIKYTCGPNCYQRIYDIDNGGFKYIYRPIDLSSPFPTTINSKRTPGQNWLYFMSDNLAIKNKMNRNESGLEYNITLSQSDITKIKTYNNNHDYFDLTSSMSESGSSSFLREIVNPAKNVRYSKLGECTVDCWVNEGDN